MDLWRPAVKARYSRWDSSQDPFGPDVAVGEVLDELSDELLSGFGPEEALRRLRRRGPSGHARGLDSLRDRVRAARRRAAADLDLSGPLQRVKERIDDVLGLERAELSLRDDEEARFREAVLDALPESPAGALAELMTYRFTSAEAAARFQALLEELRADVLNAYFSNLAGALGNVTPEELARVKDMLAELNAMVAARARGEPHDFEGFMSRHGDLFPTRPRSLDELLEILARRMAALSRLLSSLSPERRAELTELASTVMDDLDLAFQVDQLAQSLRELMPNLPWDQAAEGTGDDAMPLSATIDAVERVGELDELDRTLAGDYVGASLEDVDDDKLRRSLGEDAVRDMRRLRAIERALEESGILARDRGRLELTARGAKLLGERSLTRLLAHIRRDPTHHAAGGQAEPTGQTRPWVFGDAEPISVERTVFNAVARGGPGGAVELTVEDFEVVETESRPPTATALLLDLSFSMPLGGHWVAAKKMALALSALIEGKYPQDELFLIGFSDYARKMRAADLACVGWEHVHGTNMQHAFLLARRLLGDAGAAVKQVIMVTDGEPTAHLDEDGRAYFGWPPVRETVEKTLREAARLARSGISINVFMLESTPGLVAFMGRLAKLTGGHVMTARASELGDVIVGEYVTKRSRR
ncbi:MAG: VWA domain-containing protein [Actinomycetota bacterium]